MKPPFKPFIIPIFIPHCGCPHQCIFCNQQVITGTSGAIPSEKEIHSIINKFLEYSTASNDYITDNSQKLVANTLGEMSLTYFKYTTQEVDDWSVFIIDQPEDDLDN